MDVADDPASLARTHLAAETRVLAAMYSLFLRKHNGAIWRDSVHKEGKRVGHLVIFLNLLVYLLSERASRGQRAGSQYSGK